MTPAWLGDRLVLLRRVQVDRAEYLQGCVLDWSAIRSWLEHEATDLFPAARLEPARAEETGDRGRLLFAALREILFFYLFVAGERIAQDADEALGRAVRAKLSALEGLLPT